MSYQYYCEYFLRGQIDKLGENTDVQDGPANVGYLYWKADVRRYGLDEDDSMLMFSFIIDNKLFTFLKMNWWEL